LSLGALGVVFGDIGTSPLYTLRECLHSIGRDAGPGDVLGVLSLLFWSLTMVVTVKYMTFVMRADNEGEGGIFALLAILPQSRTEDTERHATIAQGKLGFVPVLVVVGAALLYGDGAITPSISVLSAIEGLAVAEPALSKAVVPLTCGVLLLLFSVQRRGTKVVGRIFGPIMLVWFSTIGTLGAYHLSKAPHVLYALWPGHAVRFFFNHGVHGTMVLGSVVLAVTGGEALYADMGHFGARPIRLVWLAVVMPALVLCYFGQGAVVLSHPELAGQPFLGMVPPGAATFALVGLSSVATVIASQALISGVFSLTHQAMQLGYFPRVTIRHTERTVEGQIYVPEINHLLGFACLLLVVGFRTSDRLASAYGLAVTGTMVITSIVYYVVVRDVWHWSRVAAIALLLLFLSFDVPFFAANAVKIAAGGWVPVLIGVIAVSAMLIWSHGRTLLVERYAARFPRLEDALSKLPADIVRVPGSAVFMASSAGHLPATMAHFMDRVHVLPETVVLLTIRTARSPTIPDEERYAVQPMGAGIHRLVVHFGFMERPRIPAVLGRVRDAGAIELNLDEVTYYVGRDHVLASRGGRMGKLAETLFAFLSRNATAADRHFGMPAKQVLEIGMQLDL
jgi:KUP system potassium uptake protein